MDTEGQVNERTSNERGKESQQKGQLALLCGEGSCLFREPLVGWSRRWLILVSSLGQDSLQALQKESGAL